MQSNLRIYTKKLKLIDLLVINVILYNYNEKNVIRTPLNNSIDNKIIIDFIFE